MPCPTATNDPAHRLRVPIVIAVAVTGPGCIAPDIEIEQDPKAVREGRDPQLEKAVEVLLEELRKNPPPKHERPPFPNYHRPQAGRTEK